ncbi:MAG: baseplate wedge protein 53 [Patescibacteria group bacterium]|nr:baseplate wedge protein 53 [Patescibacteria group bacterium]
MEYFDHFPYLLWEEKKQEFMAQDITIRIIVDTMSLKDKTLFYDYTLSDSENLEQLAERVYKDYKLAWLILLVNELFDREFDLPMSPNTFHNYITTKYGSVANANQIRKYFIKINESDWVEVDYEQYVAYNPQLRRIRTAYELEQEKNEAKRKIRILKEEFVPQFINIFINLLKVRNV